MSRQKQTTIGEVSYCWICKKETTTYLIEDDDIDGVCGNCGELKKLSRTESEMKMISRVLSWLFVTGWVLAILFLVLWLTS